MRDEQIKTIRDACVKVNDKIRHRSYYGGMDTIRLADVLLACFETVGTFTNGGGDCQTILMHWSLRTDDLTQQSDETIEFISSLLSA